MKNLKSKLSIVALVCLLAACTVVPTAPAAVSNAPAATVTEGPRSLTAPQSVLAASAVSAQRLTLLSVANVAGGVRPGTVFLIPDYNTVEIQYTFTYSSTGPGAGRVLALALQGNSMASSASSAALTTTNWVTSAVISTGASGGLTGTLALHGYFVRLQATMTDTSPFTLTVLGVVKP